MIVVLERCKIAILTLLINGGGARPRCASVRNVINNDQKTDYLWISVDVNVVSETDYYKR